MKKERKRSIIRDQQEMAGSTQIGLAVDFNKGLAVGKIEKTCHRKRCGRDFGRANTTFGIHLTDIKLDPGIIRTGIPVWKHLFGVIYHRQGTSRLYVRGRMVLTRSRLAGSRFSLEKGTGLVDISLEPVSLPYLNA